MDMKFIFGFILIAFCSISDGKREKSLSPFIKDFDVLNYDAVSVHRRHRRAVTKKNHFEMEFTYRGRPLKVRLQPDTSIFTSDARIQSASGQSLDFDKESLVEGSVVGDMRSHVFGAMNEGVFQGKISTADDEYYVDPVSLYYKTAPNFHSVIYSGKDVEFGGANRMPGKKPDVADEDLNKMKPAVNKRSRRATSPNSKIEDSNCVLSIYADSYFVKLFDNKPSSAIYQITQQVRAAKAIYERSFNISGYYAPKGLSFRVKKLVVYDPKTDEGSDLWKVVAPNNIGIDTLLEIFSSSPFSHKDLCEAFLFTDRDFEGGILGLAWIGEPNKAGGICDLERDLGDDKKKIYNTGIVTMRLYGSFTPPKVSEVTFAHELGHGFGSQHDPDNKVECAPGGTKGNFIMYSKATSGDRSNNNKFSNCSLKSIKANVDSKRQDSTRSFCFVASDKPICGNMVVEKEEQCDCGDKTTCKEDCCHPAGTSDECKLKAGSDCSPSQGPCCGSACKYLANNVCRNVTDCTELTKCAGRSFSCPDPVPKPDRETECAGGLKVCLKGECKVSVCEKYNLQECRCSKEGEECDLCCQQRDKPDTCQSAKNLPSIPSGLREKKMIPGTPCADMSGYCDVFHVCRRVNMQGPLLRLTQKLLTVEGLKETVKKYWWAILIGVIVLVALVILMVKVCAVYTPSSNPKKRQHRPLPGRRKKNPQGSQGYELRPRA